MTMASNSYVPPGVSVTEVVDPSISPILNTASSICLVGLAKGSITKTDAVTLTGEAAVTLPGVEASDIMGSNAIISVVDALEPSISEELAGGTYPSGKKGYEFEKTAHTIKRGSESEIPTGHTVFVTYTYTPADYFLPVRMGSLSDIVNRFGDVYDSTGKVINSPLSYAASLAFENGAQEVVLQALFYNNAGVKEQPTSEKAAEASLWADNFANLRDINSINILVPVVGQSQSGVNDADQLAIIQAAQDHAKFMRNQQQYIMVVAGEDSSESSTVAQMATLRTHATTLAGRYNEEMAEQTILVSPSKFYRYTPTAEATQIAVGGQYMAAGIAGMISSRNVSASLTRKVVSGFSAVGERRELADKNNDAAAGLLVIEAKGGAIQIRHGITINTKGGSAKREISVVRAKHAVAESIQETIETQIIGQVIADGSAPLIVQSAVISVLEELRTADDIVDYSNVQAVIASLDPTTIDVRFSYRPAFPVNYVNVTFSLDLTTGTITDEETNSVDTSTF